MRRTELVLLSLMTLHGWAFGPPWFGPAYAVLALAVVSMSVLGRDLLPPVLDFFLRWPR